jgi:hypothetical protein
LILRLNQDEALNLALKMKPLEASHAREERENTCTNNNKAKPEQVNLSNTYLSTWSEIVNS